MQAPISLTIWAGNEPVFLDYLAGTQCDALYRHNPLGRVAQELLGCSATAVGLLARTKSSGVSIRPACRNCIDRAVEYGDGVELPIGWPVP